MRSGIILVIAINLASCGESEHKPDYSPPLAAPMAVEDESAIAPETVSEPTPEPPQPVHNYDARDGIFYSYFAAISEDDRKAGKAARDVVTFAYMGRRGSSHVLARVRANRSVISEAYCNDPCQVITYSDGGQVAYSADSIIGAAFQDAIAGRLLEAEYNRPDPVPSNQPPSQPPVQNSDEPIWTEQEKVLISKWMASDQSCRFGTSVVIRNDACANRDGIYSASLAQSGICTTRKTRFGTEFKMHRCDEASVIE